MPCLNFASCLSHCDGVEMTPSQVEECGFAIVDAVLHDDEVVALLHELDSISMGGHALRNLHQCCSGVEKLCRDARIVDLARSIVGENPFVVRSIFFDKNPKANWKVAWHQDLTIAVRENIDVDGFGPWSLKDGVIHVQPPTVVLERMVTIRVHLDDCTTENGPLRVLPGSHRSGKLTPEQIADWRARVSEMECVVPRGGVVMMRPLILHASSQAMIATHRRVVHLEFAAEKLPNGLKWAVG